MNDFLKDKNRNQHKSELKKKEKKGIYDINLYHIL